MTACPHIAVLSSTVNGKTEHKCLQCGVRFVPATNFQTLADLPVRHVRVGVKRISKRINGTRGNPGRTMCGAEISSDDMSFGDWVRLNNREAQQWNVCKVCHFGAERAS